MLTTFRDLRLLTPRSVFAPRSDAGMLLDAAAGHVHGDVLDLCCGSGVIGLSVAPAAKHVTAVDASRVAVAATRLNALVNRRRVRALRGDLFGPVAGAGVRGGRLFPARWGSRVSTSSCQTLPPCRSPATLRGRSGHTRGTEAPTA